MDSDIPQTRGRDAARNQKSGVRPTRTPPEIANGLSKRPRPPPPPRHRRNHGRHRRHRRIHAGPPPPGARSSRGFATLNGEGATAQLRAVQRLNGLLGLFGRAHGDETKTAGTAGRPVHHQVGFDDGAVRRKGVLQVVFRGFEG